jgi:hypothetical protein
MSLARGVENVSAAANARGITPVTAVAVRPRARAARPGNAHRASRTGAPMPTYVLRLRRTIPKTKKQESVWARTRPSTRGLRADIE